MAVAGIDIGSRIAKSVVLEHGQIVAYALQDTGVDSTVTARQVLASALEQAGLGAVDQIIATGYGRISVPFADAMLTEISCHARGVNYYFPAARTILDIGGQDSKVINCNDKGNVTQFAMNDKCAGGTGRFLETMAELLNLSLAEMSELSLQAEHPVKLNTHCVVYVKSEVLHQLKRGVAKSELLAGIYEALVTRIKDLLTKVALVEDLVFSGGVAKNSGLVAMLRQKTGLQPRLAPEPLILGALGAAIFAEERLAKNNNK